MYISILASPECANSLVLKGSRGAVYDAAIGFVEDSLLEHLSLLLDEELHSLNGSGGSFGDGSGHAREHKVLCESKLNCTHDDADSVYVLR